MPHAHNWKDLTGKKFGRLTVISEAKKKNQKLASWLCKCDCGKEKTATSTNLIHGHTQSCGCLQKENLANSRRTHGNTNTPEYEAWQNMKSRCSENAKREDYKNYFLKGITVCERWMKFENFLSDMGKRPSKNHSLDRIENNGNYEPGNCRWATPKQQASNKSNNKWFMYKGKRMLANTISKKFGVSQYLLDKYPVAVAISKSKKHDRGFKKVA